MTDAALIARLLDVIAHDIVPKTQAGVAAGNKIFGAAILRKDDLTVIVAETNAETDNPLWHGEMNAIRRFYEMPATARPKPADCVFVATHEPCSLCLSGISWSGFDNFHYLFSHEDSRDAFAIPHDIAILRAVYAVPDPDRSEAAPDRPLYNRVNRFFASRSLPAMIAALPADERAPLVARVEGLRETYAGLSDAYQHAKGHANIALA